MVNIWIRVTKAAGTSFEKAIGSQRLPIEMITPTGANLQRYGRLSKRDNFKFSIIRNPYEKSVSSYKWLTTGNATKRLNKLKFNPNVSYLDFMNRIIELRNDYEKYDHRKLESGVIIPNKIGRLPDNTPEGEYFWIIQHTENCYNTITTFSPLEEMDAIVRLENFAEDKVAVENAIGKQIRLGHDNKTRRNRSFKEFYKDDAVMAPFLELYGADIDHFGYKLDG